MTQYHLIIVMLLVVVGPAKILDQNVVIFIRGIFDAVKVRLHRYESVRLCDAKSHSTIDTNAITSLLDIFVVNGLRPRNRRSYLLRSKIKEVF